MNERLRVLSLGGGVQSSTLALMAAHGDVESFDAAIFADTQAEPSEVYEWLDYLEAKLPFPVKRVTAGSLLADSTKIRTSRSGRRYVNARIPAFVTSENGKGLLGRQCTRDYKIAPVARELRRMMGRRSIRSTAGILVNLAIGISRDEAQRMKPSPFPWVEHYWPLVDMGITREGCLEWMRAHGYKQPPRSACVFCPFHSDAEWRRLADTLPNEFERAVAFERDLRSAVANQEAIRGDVFLHSSLRPLDEVDFAERAGYQQFDLFGNECEGMCGV